MTQRPRPRCLLQSLPLTAVKLEQDESRVNARKSFYAEPSKGIRLSSVTSDPEPSKGILLSSVAPELQSIAESLAAWATSLVTENQAASKALLHHSRSLERVCGLHMPEEVPGLLGTGHLSVTSCLSSRGSPRLSLCSARGLTSRTVSRRTSRHPTKGSVGGHPEDDDPIMKMLEHDLLMKRRLSKTEATFRQKAAQVLEKSGKPGEALDDLQEVPVAEVKDKLAISYWRFCQGLRLYRSPTVTEAVRLICSAEVPGLGGPSYLDVFNTLTQSSAWEQHIYIFGGLVRDVIRRTVGNDIDIGFSAPAAELEAICQQAGYLNQVEGDYIIIGDDKGEEYLEGMVISFNGIQPPEHADFSMNMLFYDFRNDVIVDKTGKAVDAILANRLELPCPPDRWKSWIEINGVRVCFRFYKFLVRGYSYQPEELLFVTQTLLDFWRRDTDHTIEVGRVALGSLVGCTDAETVERLRQEVIRSWEMSRGQDVPGHLAQRRPTRAQSLSSSDLRRLTPTSPPSGTFLSAKSWWEKGWLVMLKLSP